MEAHSPTLRTSWSGREGHAVYASTFTAQFCEFRSENPCGASLRVLPSDSKGLDFVVGGRRAYMVVSRKTRPTFLQKCIKKNVETKWSPFEAVDESDANHVLKKIGEKAMIWAVK